MSVEDVVTGAIDNEEEEGEGGDMSVAPRFLRLLNRNEKLLGKHRADIDCFLGSGSRVDAVVIKPRYYRELLIWALHLYMKEVEWNIVRSLGYHYPEPFYVDVKPGDGNHSQNLLRDGVLLIRRDEERLTITVDANPTYYASVLICGPASNKADVLAFAEGVETITKEQNFYRGGKLQLAERLRFLNLPASNWQNVILDPDTKNILWANTIGFFGSKERLAKYSIPPRRGVLLVGEPGTGKTLACRALMAEAKGITCLLTHAYLLDEQEYITELYEIAGDLAPSIVCIEDLDAIGRERTVYGYSQRPALLALLSTLDGIEEQKEVVTLATTNNLELIDRALGQRPSRFDRVVRISLPSIEQRKQLIASICQQIPVDGNTRDCIARGTDEMTPAQIQEVIRSLVIEQAENSCDDGNRLSFSTEQVDKAIMRINGKKQHSLGFAPRNNHKQIVFESIGLQE